MPQRLIVVFRIRRVYFVKCVTVAQGGSNQLNLAYRCRHQIDNRLAHSCSHSSVIAAILPLLLTLQVDCWQLKQSASTFVDSLRVLAQGGLNPLDLAYRRRHQNRRPVGVLLLAVAVLPACHSIPTFGSWRRFPLLLALQVVVGFTLLNKTATSLLSFTSVKRNIRRCAYNHSCRPTLDETGRFLDTTPVVGRGHHLVETPNHLVALL